MCAATRRRPVFGIGLNKTGTKTLGLYLQRWGYHHRTYDSNSTSSSPSFDLYQQGKIDALLDEAATFDSCEDWPWPLLYKELDARFPDALFVLTTRASPDKWFRSLCNMGVRLGPFPLYETTVYGYSMPQGRKAEHQAIYAAHNEAVIQHFSTRPGKLLELCWEQGNGAQKLADFIGLSDADVSPLHANRSPGNIYSGDSLWRAHMHRLHYQWWRGPASVKTRAVLKLKSLFGPG